MSILAIRSNRRQEAVSMTIIVGPLLDHYCWTIIVGIQLMHENIKLFKKIVNSVT